MNRCDRLIATLLAMADRRYKCVVMTLEEKALHVDRGMKGSFVVIEKKVVHSNKKY